MNWSASTLRVNHPGIVPRSPRSKLPSLQAVGRSGCKPSTSARILARVLKVKGLAMPKNEKTKQKKELNPLKSSTCSAPTMFRQPAYNAGGEIIQALRTARCPANTRIRQPPRPRSEMTGAWSSAAPWFSLISIHSGNKKQVVRVRDRARRGGVVPAI